jgi:hypothetical protein
MQFKSLAFLTAAFSAGQVLALNATVVVNGINNITATANDATLAINALNGTNAINTGLRVSNDLRSLIGQIINETAFIAAAAGDPALTDADQALVCTAYENLLTSEQALLTGLTNATVSAQLQTPPFGQNIALYLRFLNGIFPGFATAVAGITPNCTADAAAQLALLNTTITAAITAYPLTLPITPPGIPPIIPPVVIPPFGVPPIGFPPFPFPFPFPNFGNPGFGGPGFGGPGFGNGGPGFGGPGGWNGPGGWSWGGW